MSRTPPLVRLDNRMMPNDNILARGVDGLPSQGLRGCIRTRFVVEMVDASTLNTS